MSQNNDTLERSRRSSTVASSLATVGLQRQRAPGVDVNVKALRRQTRRPSARRARPHNSATSNSKMPRGKRKSVIYSETRKPRSTKARRSGKKRARCVAIAGLETWPHEICTASYGGFVTGENKDSTNSQGCMWETNCRHSVSGKLMWLRPRRTSSVWQQLATEQRRAKGENHEQQISSQSRDTTAKAQVTVSLGNGVMDRNSANTEHAEILQSDGAKLKPKLLNSQAVADKDVDKGLLPTSRKSEQLGPTVECPQKCSRAATEKLQPTDHIAALGTQVTSSKGTATPISLPLATLAHSQDKHSSMV